MAVDSCLWQGVDVISLADRLSDSATGLLNCKQSNCDVLIDVERWHEELIIAQMTSQKILVFFALEFIRSFPVLSSSPLEVIITLKQEGSFLGFLLGKYRVGYASCGQGRSVLRGCARRGKDVL